MQNNVPIFLIVFFNLSGSALNINYCTLDFRTPTLLKGACYNHHIPYACVCMCGPWVSSLPLSGEAYGMGSPLPPPPLPDSPSSYGSTCCLRRVIRLFMRRPRGDGGRPRPRRDWEACEGGGVLVRRCTSGSPDVQSNHLTN